MSLKSTKPAQAGHIVIQNQNEDDQSGLIVVSNTGPMEEIDGIYSSKIPSSTQIDQERKRTTSRLQSDMEKSIRIRTTRIPSGKSTQSGKNLLSPVSIPGSKLGQTVGNDGVKSNIASARIEENEVPSPEENKVFEYERVFEGRLDLYNNEEENLVCARFPHLKFCACGVDHEELKNEPPVEVFPGIFISTMQQSLATKNLLALGITHIVNVSATEFTKRRNYFEYLTFDIFDTHEEDIKKHFRITNRFIFDALQDGGKVLVHSLNSRSRAPAFILAYMIGKKKKTLKNSMDFIKEIWPRMEINPYFYKQLEQYDLEKLAIGSSIKV